MNVVVKKAEIRSSLFLSYEYDQKDAEVSNSIKTAFSSFNAATRLVLSVVDKLAVLPIFAFTDLIVFAACSASAFILNSNVISYVFNAIKKSCSQSRS